MELSIHKKIINLYFEFKPDLYKFQSEIRRLIFRKRSYGDAEFTLSLGNEQITECPLLKSSEITRVFSTDYNSADCADSQDCAGMSESSFKSVVSDVEVDDEVKLRLFDGPNSPDINSIKVQKCHIKSRTFKDSA